MSAEDKLEQLEARLERLEHDMSVLAQYIEHVKQHRTK